MLLLHPSETTGAWSSFDTGLNFQTLRLRLVPYCRDHFGGLGIRFVFHGVTPFTPPLCIATVVPTGKVGDSPSDNFVKPKRQGTCGELRKQAQSKASWCSVKDRGVSEEIDSVTPPVKSFNSLNPCIAHELKGHSVILDGEIVCLDENGKPQFYDLLLRGESHGFALSMFFIAMEKTSNTCLLSSENGGFVL